MRSAIVVIALSWAAIAHADEDPFAHRDPSNPQSSKLFDEGRAQLANGDYDKACEAFERSLVLEHASGTELNLAACEERRGHFAEAWRLYDDAAQSLQHGDDGARARAAFARKRADALLPRLATVVVHLHGVYPNVVVQIADRGVTTAQEISELVDPGKVRVSVQPPSAYVAKVVRVVDAAEGQTATVDIDVPPPPPTVIEGHRRRSWLIASGIMLFGALASITTAAIVSHYSAPFSDAPAPFAVAGVVLIPASIFTFAFAPDDVSQQAAALGVKISGRF